MVGIKAIRSTANYTAEQAEKTTLKILPPPTTKKTIQVATNIFKLRDFIIFGALQDRQIFEVLKGGIDLIEIGATVKNIFFWVNPFTKKTLDDAALKESLKFTLCDTEKNEKKCQKLEETANQIFDTVMSKETFYSQDEVREAIKQKLIELEYKPDAAERIANRVTVQQKARPITLLFTSACFTFLDFSNNVMALKKWNIIDLSKTAFEIGSKSRVFTFVVELGPQVVFGTVASAALIVTFGEAAVRMFNALKAYNEVNGKEPGGKEAAEAWQLVRSAILDMLSSGTDLLSTAVPLLFSVNPPLVAAFALVAKGTGLIIIFIK